MLLPGGHPQSSKHEPFWGGVRSANNVHRQQLEPASSPAQGPSSTAACALPWPAPSDDKLTAHQLANMTAVWAKADCQDDAEFHTALARLQVSAAEPPPGPQAPPAAGWLVKKMWHRARVHMSNGASGAQTDRDGNVRREAGRAVQAEVLVVHGSRSLGACDGATSGHAERCSGRSCCGCADDEQLALSSTLSKNVTDRVVHELWGVEWFPPSGKQNRMNSHGGQQATHAGGNGVTQRERRRAKRDALRAAESPEETAARRQAKRLSRHGKRGMQRIEAVLKAHEKDTVIRSGK